MQMPFGNTVWRDGQADPALSPNDLGFYPRPLAPNGLESYFFTHWICALQACLEAA